jgi:hypothetical protein
MLATPEEHLASSDIVYSHADRYTHGMDGVKKSRGNSWPSSGRFHLAQSGCHGVRVSGLQRAMRSDIDVQTNESQSKESHGSERQRAIDVLGVQRRAGIASPCAFPIVECGSNSAISTDSRIHGKPGRTLADLDCLRGELYLQEAASGARA